MATIDQIRECSERWLSACASGSPSTDLIHSTFCGCRDAVTHLRAKLADIGYVFCDGLIPPSADFEAQLNRLIAHTGIKPPSALIYFWRIVGGISFVDLVNYQHVDFWNDRKICGPEFCDGVYVDACNEEWVDFAIADFGDKEDEDSEEFCYSLAPDCYHKDDISGGMPYMIGISSEWKPEWENFEWTGVDIPKTVPPGKLDFVSYLRTAILECGGFPGFFGDSAFEGIRREFTRDMPPF